MPQVGHDRARARREQLLAERAPAWLPPTKPIAVMPAAVAAVTPAGESSTTMQSVGLQRPSGPPHAKTGRAPACRSAHRLRKRKRRKNVRGPWSPGSLGCGRGAEDDATHFGPRSQVSAWAACGMARSSARRRLIVAAATMAPKFGGQLALGRGLDRREHVGGPAPEEIAGHQFGRHRNADAREFLRRNRGRDLLAVDQHTIAIKDDHGSPGASAPSGTALDLRCPTNRYGKDRKRVAMAKVGHHTTAILLHSFLRAPGTEWGGTP